MGVASHSPSPFLGWPEWPDVSGFDEKNLRFASQVGIKGLDHERDIRSGGRTIAVRHLEFF